MKRAEKHINKIIREKQFINNFATIQICVIIKYTLRENFA